MSTETSIASGAATALSYADALPVIALECTLLAMFDIPAAGLVAAAMIDGLAFPGGLGDAAVHWAESGAKLEEAEQRLDEIVAAIPHDAWKGDDRTAFEGKVGELKTQLETGRVFADVVGTALITCGTVLAAYDAAMMAIGILLMFEATALAATIASVVGNLGASEAEEAADTAECVTIAEGIDSTNIEMKTISQTLAAVLVGALALFEGIEFGEGDTNVGTDILKGTVIALPDIALSLLAGAMGKYGPDAAEGGAHAAPGLLDRIPGLKALGTGAAKIAPGQIAKDLAAIVLPGVGKHAAGTIDPVIRAGINQIGSNAADRAGDRGAEVPAKALSKWLEGLLG